VWNVIEPDYLKVVFAGQQFEQIPGCSEVFPLQAFCSQELLGYRRWQAAKLFPT